MGWQWRKENTKSTMWGRKSFTFVNKWNKRKIKTLNCDTYEYKSLAPAKLLILLQLWILWKENTFWPNVENRWKGFWKLKVAFNAKIIQHVLICRLKRNIWVKNWKSNMLKFRVTMKSGTELFQKVNTKIVLFD